MNFLHSRNWIVTRRIALVIIALVVGYRSYGDPITTWLLNADPASDIIITRNEFRPSPGGDRPLWFIGLQNTNTRASYDRILIEATYMDRSGRTTEVDRIVVNQRLAPGEERFIGSRDAAQREGATSGLLRIIDAQVVE